MMLKPLCGAFKLWPTLCLLFCVKCFRKVLRCFGKDAMFGFEMGKVEKNLNFNGVVCSDWWTYFWYNLIVHIPSHAAQSAWFVVEMFSSGHWLWCSACDSLQSTADVRIWKFLCIYFFSVCSGWTITLSVESEVHAIGCLSPVDSWLREKRSLERLREILFVALYSVSVWVCVCAWVGVFVFGCVCVCLW